MVRYSAETLPRIGTKIWNLFPNDCKISIIVQEFKIKAWRTIVETDYVIIIYTCGFCLNTSLDDSSLSHVDILLHYF